MNINSEVIVVVRSLSGVCIQFVKQYNITKKKVRPKSNILFRAFSYLARQAAFKRTRQFS